MVSEDCGAAAKALWAIVLKRPPRSPFLEDEDGEDNENTELEELEGWLKEQTISKVPIVFNDLEKR